jgi:hypothetical protein
MSALSAWSYAQARMQSRHGERLQEGDWRILEAARALDQFIERARATALRRFADLLNARMSSHAIERTLRAAWRDYVAEVAQWGASDWRPAILWTAHLPDLPAIDALLRGEAPGWAQQDPTLAAFMESRHALAKSPLAVLLPDSRRAATLTGCWYAHWRSLWPKPSATERRSLAILAGAVSAHVERLGKAGPQEASAPYRRELAQIVTRMFRRHSGSPIAVFCHLALVALDLERLRGGLIRRALFQPVPAMEAA